MIQVKRLPRFDRKYKKLKPNQRTEVNAAIDAIIAEPHAGNLKIGDLQGLRVYKFRMVNQLILLAYTFSDNTITLTLIDFGPHENFYRDIK